jgi:transposase
MHRIWTASGIVSLPTKRYRRSNPMQLETITELLNIPNFKVTHLIRKDETSYHFVLKAIEETIPLCSACGRTHARTFVHQTTLVEVEDLGISGKRVFLHVPKRKIYCGEDGSIRVEQLDWIRGRFTKRFTDQVSRLTAITTNQEAGWYLGLDDEAVYRIDCRNLEEQALEKLSPIPVPTYMSVDEVAWQKWHKYITNVVDIEERKVIWNHNSRGKGVLALFYKALGPDGCQKIKGVASDGARGYLAATQEHAPTALIVLDHFHVKLYLNEAVNTVRKAELRKARQEKNDELVQILHSNQRFILLQNQSSPKKENILDKLSVLNEPVYQAMLLKDQFLSIYQAKNWKMAWVNLRVWIRAAIQSHIRAFVDLGFKFFRKRHFILNYFRLKITTAISEGINNKIKRLKRMAYGYRDVKYFLLKIHQHCGLLNPRLQT